MMFVRWLLAAPLLAASCCGVPVAYLVQSSYLFIKSRREFDFRTEVIEKAATLVGPAWPVPLALVLFAACWWMTTAWTRIALVATAPLALTGLFRADTAVVAFGAVIVGWALAWLAGRVMTWPITPDVATSAMEITFKLRKGGRLRLQSRRLLIDKLPAPLNPHAPVGRLAIPFDRIVHIEPGLLAQEATWTLANTSRLTLRPGPVLRVIGGGQEWLVPVDDPAALAALISERKQRRGKPEPRPALESGLWDKAKFLWELEVPDQLGRGKRVRHGNHHFLLGTAVVTMLMAGFGTYLIFTDGFEYLVGVGFFVLVSALALRSWRMTGVSLKLAEENPRPPTSPDPDPHVAPAAGFTRSSVS